MNVCHVWCPDIISYALNIRPDFKIHWFIHFSAYFWHFERRYLNSHLSASCFDCWPWIAEVISDRREEMNSVLIRIGVVSRVCHVTRMCDVTSLWLLFVPMVCDAWYIPTHLQNLVYLEKDHMLLELRVNPLHTCTLHLAVSSKMSLCLEIW